MIRKILIITQIAILSVFISCSKEEDPNAPGQGSITGKLRLADEFGVISDIHSQVFIDTYTPAATNSSPTGSYLIYGLKDGNFDLTYTKNGYGSYKRFGIPVSNYANTQLTGIDTLGKVSTSIVTGLAATLNSSDSTWSFECNVNPAPDVDHPRGIRLFFSKNPSVNSVDYEYSPANKWMATTSTGTINGFTKANFLTNGFSKGDTVYVVVYGESFYANVYIDPTSQKKVYPNVNAENPSNVAMFVLN